MSQADPFDSTVMTYKQVANVFAVSVNTVARWVRDGVLETIQTPGNRPRILTSSVKRFFGNAGGSR